MKPFRERNPVPIGAIGIIVLVAVLVAAFNIDKLPIIGGGTTYRAAFTEAGGLKPGDEVRIAGVKVGQVKGVDLEGDHVRVTFEISDAPRLGTQTTAAIKIKTVLGQKYLALAPNGPGTQSPSQEIPVARTTSPYDVVQALSDLTDETQQIDLTQLQKSFDVLSATFQNTPADVKTALQGLSRLSRTVASRDTQLSQLMSRANKVTGVLANRNQALISLMDNADLVLKEVQARRDVIHQLLVNTSALSQQLTGLVRDNQQQIAPALQRLHDVLAVLEKNQANLDRSVQLLAPFVRGFANVLGNGRWFDTYIQNLPPLPGTPGLSSGGH